MFIEAKYCRIPTMNGLKHLNYRWMLWIANIAVFVPVLVRIIHSIYANQLRSITHTRRRRLFAWVFSFPLNFQLQIKHWIWAKRRHREKCFETARQTSKIPQYFRFPFKMQRKHLTNALCNHFPFARFIDGAV